MGIEAIGDGIKTTILATITTGLRVYATKEIPDSLEPPCVIVMIGPGMYATSFDPDYDQTFRLILALARQDTPSAFNSLLDYIEPSGSKSIFAALDADKTLDSSCSTSKLMRHSGAGGIEWGGAIYLGTEFELQTWS